VVIAGTLQITFGMGSVLSLIIGAITGFVLTSIEFTVIAHMFKR